MTTQAPQMLFMLAEDLYRLGNATSSKLSNVRPKDVVTYMRNGIEIVRADGRGISLITEARMRRLPRGSGFIWKLPAHFPMPPGLALNSDMRDVRPGSQPDHYLLCPAMDMPKEKYVEHLQALSSYLAKEHKL